jgi:hypothetical protein
MIMGRAMAQRFTTTNLTLVFVALVVFLLSVPQELVPASIIISVVAVLTLVYLVVLIRAGIGLVRDWRDVRRTHRYADLKCPRCGYPIGSSTRCSECGEPLPEFVLDIRPGGDDQRDSAVPDSSAAARTNRRNPQ